jgi:MFS family permease
VVVDRFSRKGVLIGADLVRGALALSLVWPQGVLHAYAVAAGMAAAGSFFNPAVQAVIPAVTTEEQRLVANSVAWSTGRLVQIVASALAGGLIALIGTGPSFALNAASFAASALLVSRLRLPAGSSAELKFVRPHFRTVALAVWISVKPLVTAVLRHVPARNLQRDPPPVGLSCCVGACSYSMKRSHQ